MKTWIKTNLSKITLALALTGATTGTIGLIMRALTHENNKFNYYLKPNHEVVFGNTTIWEHKNSKYDIYLYFANKPDTGSSDFKWDGTYPDGYFKN